MAGQIITGFTVHGIFLQAHVDAFRINGFMTGQFVKFAQHSGASAGCFAGTNYAKMIAPVTNPDPKPFFDLAQILVKLATEIGQKTVVNRFQQELPGFDCGVQ
jgi:hypothetical protein